jgi:hypothetical protein
MAGEGFFGKPDFAATSAGNGAKIRRHLLLLVLDHSFFRENEDE